MTTMLDAWLVRCDPEKSWEPAMCSMMYAGCLPNALELGLRWLHDHSTRRQTLGSFLGEFFAGALGVEATFDDELAFSDEDAINCLEIGLRWLYDRSQECDHRASSPYVSKPDALDMCWCARCHKFIQVTS